MGWQTRLQRRGVKYAKYFADGRHGGRDIALEAARLWRDLLLKKFIDDELARVCAPSTRNSSGVVGVSKVKVVASNGHVYHFWQATWSPSPGHRRGIRFSVKKYGDEKAFRLAVQSRNAATQ